MVILPEIYKSKGGGGGLAKHDARTCFLCQCAGKGIPVCEAAKALLEQLDKIIYMEWPALLSQYLDGQSDQRLTSSSPSGWKDCFGLDFPSQLPDSTQLIFELKFKYLKKNVLKFLGLHKLPPRDIAVNLTSVFLGNT
jgi:hypothetical protein